MRLLVCVVMSIGCVSTPDTPGAHGVARSWHRREDPMVPGKQMPSELTGARLAYDPGRQRVLLYGGRYLDVISDAMYELEPDAGWQLVCDPCLGAADPVGEGGRSQPAFVYDPHVGAMILYGGSTGYGAETLAYHGEVWELHGNAWRLVPVSGNAPSERNMAQMVHDPDRDALWLLGGYTGSSPVGDVYTLTNRLWAEEQSPGTSSEPIALASGSIASFYEPERKRIVVLADGNGPGWDELWQHTTGFGWTRICEDCVGSTHHDAALIHVPEYDQTFLIGGFDDQHQDIAGTKILVGDHFEVFDANQPPARSAIGAAYDPHRDVVVTYGGSGPTGGDCTSNNVCGGTWELRRD